LVGLVRVSQHVHALTTERTRPGGNGEWHDAHRRTGTRTRQCRSAGISRPCCDRTSAGSSRRPWTRCTARAHSMLEPSLRVPGSVRCRRQPSPVRTHTNSKVVHTRNRTGIES
jgi:hypothetical protein